MPNRLAVPNGIKVGLSVAVFTVGAVIWLFAALSTVALTRGPIATAIISGYTVHGSKSGDTTHITLSYRDAAGRSETSTVSVSGTPSGLRAGTTARIHYDPQSPGHAVIIGLEPSLALPVAFFSLVVLGGFTVLFARVTGRTATDLPKPFRFLLQAAFASLTAVLLVQIGLQTWPHHFTMPASR